MTIGLFIYGVLNAYTTFKVVKYLFLYNKLLKKGTIFEGEIISEKILFDSIGRVPIVRINTPQNKEILVYWIELIIVPFKIGTKVQIMIDCDDYEFGIIKSNIHLTVVFLVQLLLYFSIFWII